MDVCCVCCVWSPRVLCDELITRPEESYRMWRAVVCNQDTRMIGGSHSPRWAAEPEKIICIKRLLKLYKAVGHCMVKPCITRYLQN
jgi:hypothetical protein